MLFTAPMVLAILEVRKFETRRANIPQAGTRWHKRPMPNATYRGWFTNVPHRHGSETVVVAPRVGDLIWVRESFQLPAILNTTPPRRVSSQSPVHYVADGHLDDLDGDGRRVKIRPTIHMPIWASRLTMPVSGFRIERLQDITEDGAIREGVVEYADEIVDMVGTPSGHPQEVYGTRYRVPGVHDDDEGFETAVEAYADLWDRINGPGAWDANPWVAVTSWSGVWTRNVLDVEKERAA